MLAISYVLIDLKIGKLTHQDLGQMQMYVNYFDRYVKTDAESATIGIVLWRRRKPTLKTLFCATEAVHGRPQRFSPVRFAGGR